MMDQIPYTEMSAIYVPAGGAGVCGGGGGVAVPGTGVGGSSVAKVKKSLKLVRFAKYNLSLGSLFDLNTTEFLLS